MSLINSRRERIRFLKFSFVGITGTIVDFGVMNLMRLVFNVPLVWAQGISFICAVINNFLWNRYWTYPESRTKGAPKQLLQFLIINTIGILIRTPLVPWFDNHIMRILNNLDLSLPIKNMVISQNLALGVSIFFVTFWNFFANRYWTYANIPDGDKIRPEKAERSSVEEQ
ncbi:MAG: GtrA family protein [Chloroflexota bacterium]|nr:GtrA family protein [Chloroflexota bacterium]